MLHAVAGLFWQPGCKEAAETFSQGHAALMKAQHLTCRQMGQMAGSSGRGTPSGCGRGAGGGGGGGKAPVPPSLLSACVYHHSSSCVRHTGVRLPALALEELRVRVQ